MYNYFRGIFGLTMKKKFPNLSLITILALIIGVFLFLGWLSFSLNLRHILLNQQRVHILEIAQRAARSFTSNLQREMQTLQAISHVFDDFYSYSSLDDYLFILEDINKYNAFEHVGLVFVDSKTAYLENGEKIENFIPETAINNAISGESTVSNITLDPFSKKTVIIYTTPFIINGRTEALLFATQTLENIQKNLARYKIAGEGFVVILNKKEQVIIDTQENNPLLEQDLKQLLSLTTEQGLPFYEKLISSLEKNENGVLEYTIKDTKETRLLSFVKISVLGLEDWHLIFVVPSKVVNVLQRKIFLISLSFCAALLFSFLLILTVIEMREKAQRRKIYETAFKDNVTGSYNMARFRFEMESILQQKLDQNFVLIVLDIDKFKLINDLYGFRQGDLVLNHISNVLAENTNKSKGEIFGRLIGDTFLLLLTYKEEKEITERVEKIAQSIKNCYAVTDMNYTISAYFGIYKITEDLPFYLMLDRAGLAKKNAKESINTKYMFYDDNSFQNVLQKKEIENSMQQALKDEEFKLYFQPKCSFNKDKICSAEVLVRWENRKRGLITPDKFIPIFENNGFIIKLDFYVLEQALKHLRTWLDAGLKPYKLSINFSRLHLREELTLPKIKILLDFYKIPAELIEIEITESTVMNNIPDVKLFIDALHSLGISVAMDDFGSGYSSLNVLKDLPFDTLKIDKEFLRDLGSNPRTSGVLKGIIAMLKNLKTAIVAEGVETEEQVKFLTALKCDLAQGFLYYKPLKEEDFKALLPKENKN